MTATVAAVAACSPEKPGAVAKDGSVTVKHMFGETKVPAAPKRVVSAGYTEQDDLLAVGVVPIAVTNWWGDQPFGVWPWAQPKLGGAQPEVLDLSNGIQVDRIAALKPDLIVATNAGVDEDTYKKLSADRADHSAVRPGRLLRAVEEPGRRHRSGRVQVRRDGGARQGGRRQVHRDREEQPPVRRQEGAAAGGRLVGDAVHVLAPGWRSDFLTQMGLAIPDIGGTITRDQMAPMLDSADVLIWTTESDDQQAALLADPTVAKLRATTGNRNVFTGKDLAGAIAFASPLSYPVVADQLPPALAKALG